MVKNWSKTGQKLVKNWSKIDQKLNLKSLKNQKFATRKWLVKLNKIGQNWSKICPNWSKIGQNWSKI